MSRIQLRRCKKRQVNCKLTLIDSLAIVQSDEQEGQLCKKMYKGTLKQILTPSCRIR